MHFNILKNSFAIYFADMSQQENQLMQIQQEINNVSRVFHSLSGGGGGVRGVALLILSHFSYISNENEIIWSH